MYQPWSPMYYARRFYLRIRSAENEFKFNSRCA